MSRIFISYSHDSSAHKAFVRGIADQLRSDGLDCRLDQYINGFPAEGWQRWMEDQVEQADFVLLVCTPAYLERYRGKARDGGRGVNFEGVVISQTLYDAYYRNTKFIPVLPEDGQFDDVPLPLKGFSAYTLPADYDDLYRLLTDQAATPAPEIGEKRVLAPLANSPLLAQLPENAVANIEELLQSQTNTLFATLENQSSHIALLEEKIISLKEERDKALEENRKDRKKQPLNPLLNQEQQALLDYDFLKAAELREAYYQEARKAKLQQREQLNTELAQEALIAAERWATAFKLDKALERYQEASQFKPDLPEAWRGIHLIATKLGNNQLALAAAQSMQKHLDPEKDKWWLALANEDQGDALVALGRNKEAMQKYQKRQKLFTEIAQKSPDNPDVKRELSVSHNKVGDMHKANGDNKAALNAYQEALTIRKQLAKLDPNHTEWQRDLSVSYDRVGDMHKANGDNKAALNAYQEALTIRKQLAKLDPNHTEWQRDLSVSYDRVGDMHKANGDNKAALNAYQNGLEIAKQLAKLDPNHTEWQRDLSVSYDRVGDMHKANSDNKAALNAYQDALEIAKQLAKLDPNHTEWQRDLSVSYDRVGDMHKANGDNKAALNAYQNGLEIAKQLAKLDPNHTEWQRDLSVNYNRVGDMHKANSDNKAALNAYQDALEIAKQLAKLDPNVVEWQTDLVASYYRMAELNPKKTKQYMQKSLTILQKLHDENRLSHYWQQWVEITQSRLDNAQ